jgi:hypothetical protein
MRVYHAPESLPDDQFMAVFLMGPTPRAPAGLASSWRQEAIRLLEESGFTGEVFVPEPRGGKWSDD